jgi:hypothetical protein
LLDAHARVGDRVGRFQDDAQRLNVVDLLQVQPLALHFAVDGVDVLGPSGDRRRQLHLVDARAQQVGGHFDVGGALGAAFGQLPGNGVELIRVQVAKGQVFQLPLELPDAQPVGQRGVDVQRLVGELLPPRRVQRRRLAQPLDAVGHANQDDADVAFDDRKNGAANCVYRLYFAVLVRLFGQPRVGVERLQPGDQRGYLRAERFFHVGDGNGRVRIKHVVQNRGGQGGGVDAKL